MKKNIRIILISIILLIILAAVIIPKLGGNEESPATVQRNTGLLQVKAMILHPETIDNNILVSGTIIADEEVELKSEISGKIISIFFDEGRFVSKGDSLVKINDSELRAQLQRLKFRQELLSDIEFRQKKLLEKNAISQEEYDTALNELNVNKAEIQVLQAQLDKTIIRASFNGIIGLRNVSEGSYVTNNNVIASLQSLSFVKVDFAIPERYSSDIKTGDQVNFKISGIDVKYTATVYAIEPKIDPVTRTLKIRAKCSNPGMKLLPGSFADVEVLLKKISNTIMVPTESVVPELKGQKVFLYKDGKVFPQSIQTGIRTDKRVQVINGLMPNDTLITTGILQVKPDMPVKISEIN
ncbi:MAG: efflux RND transporter periplasmic adaptor subunit [Ignavibacteriales bacterium]|nr:MAG: efflux RND transporter periplasmic adaptor subunit [Ignavibacteriales bacterium]